MKTIKQPSYFNSRNIYRNTLTHAVLSFISLTFIMLALLMPTAHADEPYRFDRLWPNLVQPWYFVFPNDVAIGPDGLVYVADTDFHRIQVFSPEGEFIRSWGNEGVGDGEFSFPRGIAVTTNGEVYVADTENHRIQRFDANGVFKRKWGAFGSGNREFVGPSAIDVSADGEVYVVDSFNDRIQVYDANGVFKRKWGSGGSGDDEFNFPQRIAVSSSGEVYVADTENHRIQVYDANGVFKLNWGSEGSGNSEFNLPLGITVSTSGEVFVADAKNNRIQVFDTSGEFKRKWGNKGFGDGEFNYLSQAKIGKSGITGITVSADGDVYVVDTQNQRIQIFDSFGVFKRKWGSKGSGDGEFSSPTDIAISASGEVYVAGAENNRIQVFDANGAFKRKWGSKGDGDGEFDFPGGIAVSNSGEVYVVDRSNHRIQVFDSFGVFKRKWGSKGSGDGEFSFPKSIAVSASGEVYVADRSNHRIQVFDANGVFKRKWGSRGAMDGEFDFPKAIAVSASGEVYVADTFNNRIQVFDTSGVFKRKWGSEGFGDDEFSGPQAITISTSDEVYVTDSFKNPRIQIFNAVGQFIDSISSRGSSPGQIHFPSGVAFNSEDILFVVDTGNRRIQKFVRDQTTTQHPFKAIILAGGGPPTENYRNLIWNETQLLTNKAHQALRSQGFQKDEVKFFTAGNTQSDLDGNGLFDDFEPATLDSLRQGITEWAIDADNVVIYLADHGGPGRFQVNDLEILDTNQLTQWVQELDDQISGKVTLIIEACKSESFLTPLAADQRYLIASADADQPAIISNKGLNAFSYFFWSEISSGADLQGAFKIGRQGMSSQLIEGRPQNAQLDSNGDQKFSSADFSALADFCLGNCTKYAANPPSISEVTAPTTLNGATEATLSMQVSSLEPILKAWVVITRPDFRHTDSDEPVSELPQIVLQCDDSQLCSTSNNEFDLNGKYQLTFYVLDNKDQPAIPKTTMLTQTQGNPSTIISNEYSGSWYDPSHDGEGFAIEILANGQTHVTWYTYDKNGQQAWIVGVGIVNGNTINVTETITTRGGVFGEAFNPDNVVREVWGSILFTFSDCNHAKVNYAGPAGFGSGSLSLERLTSISGLDCTQPSAEDPSITLGKITGTWYDPDHDGEGYVIEVLNNNQAVVFWYTYDENGNQIWITGDGQVQGHSIVINNTIFTEGGIFGSEFDPASVQRKDWGQIRFDFSSCNTGVVNYESTAGFGSGQLNLVRLTSIDGYACETLP